MATAIQTILGIENAMVRDFNGGKIDRLLAHFHPRVVGFSSTKQERIAGRSAMRKTFEYYQHATSRIKYSYIGSVLTAAEWDKDAALRKGRTAGRTWLGAARRAVV